MSGDFRCISYLENIEKRPFYHSESIFSRLMCHMKFVDHFLILKNEISRKWKYNIISKYRYKTMNLLMYEENEMTKNVRFQLKCTYVHIYFVFNVRQLFLAQFSTIESLQTIFK